MAVLVKVNFHLQVYTPPVLNDIDFGLSVYAPVLDGDDFALALYSPPALNAVNFALVAQGYIIETIQAKEFPMHYHEVALAVKELRSTINGVTPTIKASIFPHLVVNAGKQKELISDYA